MADANAPVGPGDDSADMQPPQAASRLPWQIVAGLLMLVWGIRWLTDPMLRTAVWLLLCAGNAAAWSAAAAPLLLYCALQAASLALAAWTMVTGVRLLRQASAALVAVRVLLASAGVTACASLLPQAAQLLAAGGGPAGAVHRLRLSHAIASTTAPEIGAAVLLAWFIWRQTTPRPMSIAGFACLLLVWLDGLAGLRGSLAALEALVGPSARIEPTQVAVSLALPSALMALGTAFLLGRRVPWARGAAMTLLCLRLLRVLVLFPQACLIAASIQPALVSASTHVAASLVECAVPLYFVARRSPGALPVPRGGETPQVPSP